MTERDVVFLLHGYQGLPLPGSRVAKQGLCDDDNKGSQGGKLYEGKTNINTCP